MKRQIAKTQLFFAGILGCCLALSVSGAGLGETNSTETAAKPEETISTQEVMRAYLQLQEQLHTAQLAIERTRQDSEAAAARNAEAWSNRLAFIEQSLNAQRERELEAMQSSNRTMLVAVGTFAGLGFIAMLFTSWLQWRAANRLSEMAASSHMTRSLIPGFTMPPLGVGDLQSAELNAPTNLRLLDAIGQLEKLVRALEHTAAPPLNDSPSAEGQHVSNGDKTVATPENGDPSDKTARVTLLLGKGQSLLNLNETEDAVACFDEVLSLDGNNTEALVKKGVALERQRKLNEAIECYDRAIAADSSMTIAYLYKGGIYNRLERFSEALECYEKALRTQEKRRAS